MLQVHANNIRSRLRLTASALVVAAGMMGSAQAQTTLTGANTPWVINGDTTVTNLIIASGSTGFLTADYNAGGGPAGSLAIVWSGGPQLSSTGSCNFGGCFATSDIINVAAGGKLIVDNPWGWQPFQSIFNATGNTEFLGGTTILMGTNTFLGNFEVDGGTLQVGQNWATGAVVFGPNTNVIAHGATLEFWMGGASTTIGGTVSGTGTFAIHSGTIGVNGINTAGNAFTGTVSIDGGGGLVIGDVAHATAVFGDPTASATVINVGQSGGSVGTLKGYGTIYGSVNNGGSVTPGGAAGTLGTLTIHGNYTQTALGQVVTSVTPTGTSKVAITGTANLAGGTLIVKVANGTYTTPALFSVLSSSALTGSFGSITVQGNAAFVGAVRSSTGYSVAVESSSSPQSFAHQVQVNRFNVAEFSRAIYDRLDTKTDQTGKVIGWLSPYGSVESVGHNGLGFSNTTYGVRGGVEYHSLWKNAVIGLAGSFGSGSMDVKGEGSTADSNTYTAAIYGGVDFLYARIDGSLSLSKFDSTINRSLGTLGTVTSAPEGSTWGASVKISQDIFGGLVTPFAAGYMQRVHLDGATEVGNSFALRYNAIDKNYMVADLGAKVHVIRQPTFKLDFTLAVEHDFSDRGESAVAQFANIAGSSAAYYWKGDSENTLITGLYLADSITSKLDIYARVNGQFSTYKRAADFSIGAKLKI